MKYKLIILCSLLNSICWAQNTYNSYLKDATSSREHSLDITHMKLEVAFEPKIGLVRGKVTHQFNVIQKRVDSVFFDGPGIKILNANHNGKKLNFKTISNGIWVFPETFLSWDQTGEISFEYTAMPKKGIYFIGWNIPEPKIVDPFAVRKQIWTQGQGIDNRYWIPMYDDMNDKFTTETITTFDKNYQVLSNGKFISKKGNKDGTITWHYSMSKPHAGYLLMLGIGKYAIASTKSKNGTPINFWYYPEFPERVEPTFKYSAQMLDFLEQQTGIPFPWESYSQIMVQDFMYGAMENTTATLFGDFFNVDSRAFLDKNYIGVNCHELTHQWFGDFITARDGRDAWLQESFATYFPKQFSKVIDGKDEWDWQRRAHQISAIEAGKKDNFAVRHTMGGTARVYPKGAAVISMLEYVLGEEQWKRVLSYYLKKHAYGNVETNDLQQAIKDVLGLNLDWFFDEWILRGGEPNLRVHYEELSYSNGTRGIEVAIEQIHKMDETIHPFRMPIRIDVFFADGSSITKNDYISESFDIIKIDDIGSKKVAFVLVDPNSNILKQISFKKSFAELEAQLGFAPNMLDRYDALLEMKNIPISQKREIILKVLSKERHEGILSEALSQLAFDANSIIAIRNLFAHPRATVREQVLKCIEPNESNQTFFENALTDSSYEVVKTALEKLCYAFPNLASKYLEQTKSIKGMNHSVEIKRLELCITYHIDEIESRNILTNLSSDNYEFRTRILAFQALKSTATFNEEVIGNLFQAMLSSNSRLANPAFELTNHFSASIEFKSKLKNYYQNQNYSISQKEILQKSMFLQQK